VFPFKDDIPTDRFPLVTVALIFANCLVYVLAANHGGSLISGPDLREATRYGAIPYEITHNALNHAANTVGAVTPLETVLTAMFMHSSVLHLAGDVLFLWLFGSSIEDAMGGFRFLLFYIDGGIAAVAVQLALEPNSTSVTLGASGAIAAVVGGYLLLYRRSHVLAPVFVPLMFTVIELPAQLLLGAWFALQLAFAAAKLTDPAGAGGAVAYFTWAGGLIFGLVTINLIARYRKPLRKHAPSASPRPAH
jgi:membrane associated rhomboid family serine protease